MELPFFWISGMLLIMELEGHATPLPMPVSPAGRSLSLELNSVVQRREKRCSCENLKDKECVYFCHIGIVWINTPSQIIPYGVGSLQMRLRRDAARCHCRNKRDIVCRKFCSLWGEKASAAGKSKKRYKITVKQRRNSGIQNT